MKLSLASIVKDEPVEDPYEWQFSSVVRGPLPETTTKRLIAAIVPGDETKIDGNVFKSSLLQVMVDFVFIVNVGDESPSEEAEKIMGIIQRRILKDRTMNGLAIETKETGNAVDLDSSVDKSINGSVFFEVLYRHDLDEPRKYLGQVAPEPSST